MTSTDFLALGGQEYGARYGIWRLLDVLDRHQIKATVITSGLVDELFPESVREVASRGHEVATHSWDQSMHPPVFKTREEERSSITKSIAVLEETAKQRIVGYMSPGPRAYCLFSLDHFGCPEQHRLRNRQIECLGRSQVDDELELRRPLYRQFGRLAPLEDFINVRSNSSGNIH